MPPEIWEQLEPHWESFKNAALDANSALEYAIAAAVALVVYLVLWTVKGVVASRFTRWGEKLDHHWLRTAGEVVRATRQLFLIVLALFCGSLLLKTSPGVRYALNSVTIAALLIQSGFWGNKLMSFGIERFVKGTAENEGVGQMTSNAIKLIGGIALWSIVLLAILANFGVDVTAMVAGLGVGGIAVALAAQNILGDLFSSLSIVIDKPFVPGDFIIVGDFMGTVERVGLKTTRVKSLSGEQIVFSNTDLLQSRIRNYKRMEERRIAFSIGITYDTPAEKVKLLPELLREVVESTETTRFDRAHFKSYGDFALIYEIVYYVLVADYNVFMDVQQKINLDIFERCEAEGIEFAYPTQTLYVKRDG